ncbi:MAG: oligosaccharide flippase family protein [Methylobacteriaceae bacterium]|nr:oligosaccharide flippase family protein [Methylobacteriaceae bacterium]
MITEHALLYLSSRLFAAAANLAAVALFTRLAASDVYGGYLLIFSWAFVIYGFLGQWLGAAFFAIYQREAATSQIGVLGRLWLGSLGMAGTMIAAAAVAGVVPWPVAGALFLVVMSLLLFITVMEAERTRLEARVVATILVLRAALMIGFGTLCLVAGGGALALAVALALANIVAALPGLVRLAPHFGAASDRTAMSGFFAYGWPLMVAFGATALGQNVDRLVLAHVVGTVQLGPYGASSDFLKQSFGVICEAIVLAVVSIAKNAAAGGDEAGARRTLEDAFRALSATVLFGAAFMTTFAGELVQIVFGPDFRATARAIVPSLIAANAVLIFRAFYFGQAIYFGQSSRNEIIAAALMLSVTGALSLALIPRFGIFGAAWAATAGQVAAASVYIVARPRMPIPMASFLATATTACGVFVAAALLDRVEPLGPTMKLAGKLAIFVAAGAYIIWHQDILGLKKLLDPSRRDFAGRLDRGDAHIADRPWS